MIFLAPAGLALGLLAIPIVGMYVLKLRRPIQPVSSTFLWRRVTTDAQANVPWQRLRSNILLVLQLLTLIALVLAIAQPAYTSSRSIAGNLVVIIDQSYGMQVVDGATSRFAEAQAEAKQLTGTMASDNAMSVIGMGAEPVLAIAGSANASSITRAIDGLRPSLVSPNFQAALSLASSLSGGNGGLRVVVLTSRDSGITGLPLSVSFPVEIQQLGQQPQDLGITAFSAAIRHGHDLAVLRIHNFGLASERTGVNLLMSGHLAQARQVAMGPVQDKTIVWNNLRLGQVLQVHLTRVDGVATDKTVWATIPPHTVSSALLVTAGDYFLQTAFSLNPSIRLTTISAGDYGPSLASRFDLVIFDGVLPPSLPNTSVLLISPPRGRVGVLRFGPERRGGSLKAESLSGNSGEILRFADIGDVQLARLRNVTLPAWMQPIASVGRVAAISTGQRDGLRVAVMNFNLQESDFPLRLGFPIVMQNLFQYLVPGLPILGGGITPGEAIHLSPAPGTRLIQVTLPTGDTQTLHAPFNLLTDTSLPGVYTLHEIGPTNLAMKFAVNFFKPESAPSTGSAILHFGHPHRLRHEAGSVNTVFAWSFGLLALVFLSAEWWFAFRG